MGSAVQNIASAKSQITNNIPTGKSSTKKGIQTKNFLGDVGSALENATGIGGGRRVDPVADITHGVQDFIRNPIDATATGLTNLVNPGNAGPLMTLPTPPTPPKVKSDADKVQEAQAKQYDEYKEALPGMRNQLQSRLSQSMNQDIASGQRNTEERNVARGLGYGGVNEGQKGMLAAQGQQDLAGQISGANQGLLDLGNQIQGGTIQTGLGIQGLLQQNADTQYQRQRSQQASRNAQNQALLGVLGNVGMMAAI